jgi:hypothetical protein
VVNGKRLVDDRLDCNRLLNHGHERDRLLGQGHERDRLLNHGLSCNGLNGNRLDSNRLIGNRLEHRREQFFRCRRLDEALDNRFLREGQVREYLGNRFLRDALGRDPLAATEQSPTAHRFHHGNLEEGIVSDGFVDDQTRGIDRSLFDCDVLDGHRLRRKWLLGTRLLGRRTLARGLDSGVSSAPTAGTAPAKAAGRLDGRGLYSSYVIDSVIDGAGVIDSCYTGEKAFVDK